MTRRHCLWQLINIGSSSTVFLTGIIPSPGHRWHRSDLLCWIGLARCQMWWIRWHNLGQSVIHKMDVCRGWGHSVTNINNTRTYPRDRAETLTWNALHVVLPLGGHLFIGAHKFSRGMSFSYSCPSVVLVVGLCGGFCGGICIGIISVVWLCEHGTDSIAWHMSVWKDIFSDRERETLYGIDCPHTVT